MGSFLPNTAQEQQEMLEAIGFHSFEELFSQIPQQVRLGELNLPAGLSEMQALERMEELAQKNRQFRHIFRGAGAYDHYIPSVVGSVIGKEQFVTAYTPYQAEISQGILQSIFEYQTMICELTQMAASNASVYDGATAAAEAVAMCRERKRRTAYVSETAHPEVIKVIKTYCYASNTEVVMIRQKDGVTDMDALREALDEESACFYMQQPNFYGNIEDASGLAEITHGAGAKFIMGCNPIALAILQTPGECGADVAVGEGQPLGLPLAFGGPYLGFMAASEKMVRRLPGRIVGETKDQEGNRAFVLTLQAREQHIRREKASSNICSNQALCALAAGVYMAAMGEAGMTQAARLCVSKAHYLQQVLSEAGLSPKYDRPFFHEFVTVARGKTADILQALEEKGILGGYPLNGDEILWCATEKNTKETMDLVASVVKEVCS
ncbi:aminomethyl-transferring glycine dehydrogenase subunit GcvPA [Parablautia sp. Marseille-Q6255]|uniref:aminomethyl-transferring glycine dehydrogenase subunit GcvPA n=1 Tax=Parablautia sp. Marseille-Q6255 TaxID=3039593 RepID=UPI0024BCA39B|nr:aminomethyl-transferring glycine dehydrogenase subunit GcvPA [Parablautia sp. Marseille-Q6255]